MFPGRGGNRSPQQEGIGGGQAPVMVKLTQRLCHRSGKRTVNIAGPDSR
jgi:hypothetical protein